MRRPVEHARVPKRDANVVLGGRAACALLGTFGVAQLKKHDTGGAHEARDDELNTQSPSARSVVHALVHARAECSLPFNLRRA